jgi:dienelactone hydrolase/uncharacterized damage-inducible protein DinB
MVEVMLFHHSQGLTAGVVAFADELRRAGHTVHTPDLYDGKTFETLEQGVGYAQEIGFEVIGERAKRAAALVPAGVVYAGFSLGVMAAQQFAQTREGAKGAVLMSACLPRSEFGEAWPAAVPVQIHGKADDPEFNNEWDLPSARAIAEEAKDGELFVYPGDQHLFADSSLSSYDPDATKLLTERVLAFLDRIGSQAEPGIETDEHGRQHPPTAGDEAATLLGFLDYQRATFAWKCRGLDATGLNTTVGASTMTLGGMMKHVALVEDDWFSVVLHGNKPQPPWDTVDWKADRDWDWHSAADNTPDELFMIWDEAVERSRTMVADALAESGMDRPAWLGWSNGLTPNLRWIVTHMIEEYARHNGHADLIREFVDGETGE